MGTQAEGSTWNIDGATYTIKEVKKEDGKNSVHLVNDKDPSDGKKVDELTFASWVASGKAQVVAASSAVIESLKELGIEKEDNVAYTPPTSAPPPPLTTTNYKSCKLCGGELKEHRVPGNEVRWVCYGKGYGGGCGGAFAEDELGKQ